MVKANILILSLLSDAKLVLRRDEVTAIDKIGFARFLVFHYDNLTVEVNADEEYAKFKEHEAKIRDRSHLY
jgi:hypothetical protein